MSWHNTIKTFIAATFIDGKEYTIYECRTQYIENHDVYYAIEIKEPISDGSAEMVPTKFMNFDTLYEVNEYLKPNLDLNI